MFLVTGSTGTIGREVVRQLVAAGAHVRAMTRDPTRTQPRDSAVEVVRGDFDDSESLARSLAGVESVFLVCPPGPSIPARDLATIRAATSAGARKIVKLSALGTGVSTFRVSRWHEAGEEALRSSKLAWALLRPAGFASNALRWTQTIRAQGVVESSTGDGRQGIIDPRDIAAVAVAALTTDAHDKKTYTLTGPELLSVPEQVAILAEALQRKIEVVDVPPEVLLERMVGSGLPREFVDAVTEGTAYLRAGRAATLDPAAEAVLGRKPRAFAEWVADHLAAFA